MAAPGSSVEVAQRAQDKAERRRRVLDLLEPRLVTILIFMPPTFGAVLGGVAITTYRRFTGHLARQIPGDYVTLGLGIFTICGLGVISFLSIRAYRGGATRFPRLLRVAPFTAVAGLILGLALAWLKATHRIH